MKAYNISELAKDINYPKYEIEVSPICEVMKHSFNECEYQYVSESGVVKLFERVFISEDLIPEETKWLHYKINNKIYKSFFTNNIEYWENEAKTFSTKVQEEYQLSLF